MVESRRRRLAGRTYGVPVVLAALTLFGLLAALLGEGPWHVLSWLALSIPLVSIAWHVSHRAPDNGVMRLRNGIRGRTNSQAE
jgi:hypothetical protein